MNHLKIDKLTQEHLVGPTFNLLKGICKSHVELEYNFEECYKALTDRLHWNNPEGKEYPFDLSKPLPLIMNQGHQVIPVDFFINKDLKYLKGGSSTKKYTTSTTKTKAAKYDIPDSQATGCPNMMCTPQRELLQQPRDVLHDITANLRMDYLPKRKWSNLDKKRSRIMIRAIDKLLFERRLMRSLEKFIDGRDYGNDLRLLERTI
nr:hypothetical protein [Tanacetum cinerariifolium]